MLGKRPFETVAIISVFTVCVAVRFWGLTENCLWFDEIFTIHAAEHNWPSLFQFAAKDLIHPPLFYVVLKLWIGLGGESLFWLRLLPVILSALAFVPVLMLCRELKIGTVATLTTLSLFAVNGALIKYAQEVRMYSLLLLLSSTSIWLFARYFFRGKSFWILVAANVLLVNTHYFGWLVVLVEFGVIAIAQRIKIVRMLRMLAVTIASSIPWVIILYVYSEQESTVKQNIGWMTRPGPTELFSFAFDLIDPFYFQTSSSQPAANYAIVLPMLAIIALAKILYVLDLRERKNRDRIYFAGAFLAAPLAVVFVFSWLFPVSIWGSRHLLIVFVPAMVVIGIYLAELAPQYLKTIALTALLCLAAAAFVIQARSPSPSQIWCAWNVFAGQWQESTTADPDPKRIYVFEDLIAYHYWFATRNSIDWKVVLVPNVEGVPNDPAYFLPRGFDEVEVADIGSINESEIWISFRQPADRRFESPVTNLENLGYVVADTKMEVFGTQAAYLIKMKKAR